MQNSVGRSVNRRRRSHRRKRHYGSVPWLDDLQVARAQHAAGSALAATGKGSEGEALLQDALATAERLANRRLQALALSDLGTVRSRRKDVNGARRFYAEALALYVSLDLERPAASIAGHLAEVEFEAGDPAAALHRAEEARIGHAATRNRRSEAADLSNMAAYLVALDCFDDACSYASQALEAAQDVRSPVLTAFVLQHVAAIATLYNGLGRASASEAGTGGDVARLRRSTADIAWGLARLHRTARVRAHRRGASNGAQRAPRRTHHAGRAMDRRGRRCSRVSAC